MILVVDLVCSACEGACSIAMMQVERESFQRQSSSSRSEVRTERRQIQTTSSQFVSKKSFSSEERRSISSKFLSQESSFNGVHALNGVDNEIRMLTSKSRLTSDGNSDAGSESSAVAEFSNYRHRRRSSTGSQGRRGSIGSNASQGSTTKVSSVTLSMRQSPFSFEDQSAGEKSRSGINLQERLFCTDMHSGQTLDM